MDMDGETLTDFLRRLWRSRLAIVLGGCAGLIFGALLIATLQPHYEARMIVAPSLMQDTDDSIANFETGQPVQSRALSLISEKFLPPEFTRFEQVLRGQSVAAILAKYDGVLANIAKEGVFRFQPDRDITAASLSDYLQLHVKIEPIGLSSSRLITYAHPDPEFAMQVLKRLHTIADTTIRQKTAAETQDRIAWLQKELAQTANPDHRTALTTLLMAQERGRMLVAMDQPYTAEIVEPPSVSAKPDWPRKSLVLFVTFLVGAFAGFVISSLRRSV